MNIITKKELLIISIIFSIVVLLPCIAIFISNQYICLNEALQTLLFMEVYVNKSQLLLHNSLDPTNILSMCLVFLC